MTCSVDNTTCDTILFPADCTIRSIGLAFDALRLARPADGLLHLDCAQVEQADLSFVQLLLSAHRTFAADGVRLVGRSVPPCIRSAFTRAGVPSPIPEHQSHPEELPWLPC